MPLSSTGFRQRRLSMTSLIDVIFLLLLFFMLSTSFSRYAEIPLAAGKTGKDAAAVPPRILQIAPDTLSLNGKAVASDQLTAALAGQDAPLLVTLRPGVSAQRLTDVLDLLQRLDGLDVTVIE
jgi:biopolymer transport protein ExbD